MTILIIDDDPEDSLILTDAIKEVRPDANCIVKYRCDELYFVNERSHPSFIFLDSNMHPIGGRDCLRQIREVVDTKFTTIIVQSGAISPEDNEEFQKMGADRVITKANSFESLRTFLREILFNPKAV